MKFVSQPSQEDLVQFFSSPLFGALKGLSAEQTNVARWWLQQPTKAEISEMEKENQAEEAVVALRHQTKQGQIPNSATAVKMLEYIKAHPGCARRDVLSGTGLSEVQYQLARKSLMERGLIRSEGSRRDSVLFAK